MPDAVAFGVGVTESGVPAGDVLGVADAVAGEVTVGVVLGVAVAGTAGVWVTGAALGFTVAFGVGVTESGVPAGDVLGVADAVAGRVTVGVALGVTVALGVAVAGTGLALGVAVGTDISTPVILFFAINPSL